MSWRRWLAAAAGAQVGALACGAATNLLYARLLAPAQIGRLAILLAVATGIVLLADSGFQLLLARELARRSAGPGFALTLLVRVLPLLVVVWWGLAVAGSYALGLPILSLTAALFVLELAVSLWLFQVALTLHQGLGSYNRRSALVLANAVATTVLTAAALVPAGSLGRAVHATALAYFLVGAAGVLPLVRRFGFERLELARLRACARTARPLWVNSAVTFAASSADVLLAGLLLPLAAVGYYQVLKKLALVVLAPLTTLLPLVYSSFSRLSPEARARVFRRVYRAAACTLGAGLLAVAPLFPLLLRAVFGRSVAELALPLAALIAVGGLQLGHNLLGYFITAGGLFKRPLVINTVVVAGVAAGAPLLGPVFGLKGFITALALGNAAGLVAGTLLAARTIPAQLVARSSAIFAAAAGVSLGLLALRPAGAIPLGLAGAATLVVGAIAADRRGARIELQPVAEAR